MDGDVWHQAVSPQRGEILVAQRAENGNLTDALNSTSLLSRITRVYKNEMYPNAGPHTPEVGQTIQMPDREIVDIHITSLFILRAVRPIAQQSTTSTPSHSPPPTLHNLHIRLKQPRRQIKPIM